MFHVNPLLVSAISEEILTEEADRNLKDLEDLQNPEYSPNHPNNG
jgi:hypothetical protein